MDLMDSGLMLRYLIPSGLIFVHGSPISSFLHVAVHVPVEEALFAPFPNCFQTPWKDDGQLNFNLGTFVGPVSFA